MDNNNTHLPLTLAGVEKFLASQWVEGIGPVYARRLVEKFGIDAWRVLRDKPEMTVNVPGVGESRAQAASDSLRNIKRPAELVAFLYSCGLTDLFIDRIFGKYRNKAEEIILRDPYSMVEDVWQLSFFTADKIGRLLNISDNDSRRLRGALITSVKHFADEGHLFATPDEAVDHAASIASVSPDEIRNQIQTVVEEGRLVKSRNGLYLPVFYKAEKEGADKIAMLSACTMKPIAENNIPQLTGDGEPYSQAQLKAISTAVNSPFMVLTGGPGSGKTTVLRGIIDTLESQNEKVVLCAPTGRAAKRMTALTGSEATTIHRLLGYRQGEGYNTHLIDASTLIIDEGSMMEQVLFNHLLDALRPGTRIIMVGDVDQLPAIGAGDVLRDLIDSNTIPVIRLDDNFRQTKGSLIASGANSINSGEIPESDNERDFIIIEETGTKAIHDRIIKLMTEELPEKRGISPTEIQIVSPQQIGSLGARQLNIDIQQHLNPEGPALQRGNSIMRLGDPVMQTANSRERGVYNGEIGRITAVTPETQTLEVTFTDGRKSIYKRSELTELILAYATTVHKLQGSEIKHMIFPITMAHKPMLYRNLLYTGVSRATDLCVLVGEPEALQYAVSTTPATTRNSNLKYRLQKKI